MSYTSSYAVFDKDLADAKFKAKGSAEIKHIVKTYTEEEFAYFYVELGSTHRFRVEDGFMIEQLARAHDLPFDTYLSQSDLLLLFQRINSEKVKELVDTTDDIGSQVEKVSNEINYIIESFAQIARNDDPLETQYSIEDIQRYVVPLFNTHGFVVYTKVSKQEILDLMAVIDTSKVKEAVTQAAFVDEIKKNVYQSVTDTLKGLRKIAVALKEKPKTKLVFTDDYGIYPDALSVEIQAIFNALRDGNSH